MTQIATSIAVLYWLALTGISIGVYAAIRTRRRTGAPESAPGARFDERFAKIEAALNTLRGDMEASVQQGRAAEASAPAPANPLVPGPALNLTKRSQALRMYRRGDAPDQIAAALAIPHQEIDLLLKVHRIVIGEL